MHSTAPYDKEYPNISSAVVEKSQFERHKEEKRKEKKWTLTRRREEGEKVTRVDAPRREPQTELQPGVRK